MVPSNINYPLISRNWFPVVYLIGLVRQGGSAVGKNVVIIKKRRRQLAEGTEFISQEIKLQLV